MTPLNLGFIPLTDCAPLLVAKAQGFFAAEGLEVTLHREASWATVRDKVSVGALDGAHMLAPIALAAGLGDGGSDVPMLAPLALNRNGAALTISTALAQDLGQVETDTSGPLAKAKALATTITARKAAAQPPLTFAVVFPFSLHNYALRYWMAQAGIDPDRDVRLMVTPPVRMVDQLRAGTIDGFCVGEPWNAVAVSEGLGEVLVRASEIWSRGSDKVLGLTRAWAEANPGTLQAVLRALLRAGQWADAIENRPSLVALLSRPDHLGAYPGLIAQGLQDEIVFQADGSAVPAASQGAWFLTQMARWGQVPVTIDALTVAQAVYRPDLCRTAAQDLGLAMSTNDSGSHQVQVFFDGPVFEPNKAKAYAQGFSIRRGYS